MKTKSQAIAESKKALKKLKTRGWSARVWNNGNHANDWQWELSNVVGHFVLQPIGEDGEFYSRLSGGRIPGTGSCDWPNNFTSRDPNKVVKKQLDLLLSYVSAQVSWAETVQSYLGDV